MSVKLWCKIESKLNAISSKCMYFIVSYKIVSDYGTTHFKLWIITKGDGFI